VALRRAIFESFLLPKLESGVVLTVITSKDNPSVKLYMKLSSSKKERRNSGLYVLEGFRLIEDAVNEKALVKQLFFTEDAYEKYSDELSQVDLKEVKILIISNELGIKISCTEKPQGVFAICEMPPARSLEKEIIKSGKYVVLHGLQDPGNLGMIIRTADAVGMDGVILSESCELYSPKVIRSTMGSAFRMKIFETRDTDELFSCLEANGIKSYAAVIDKDAVDLRTITFDGGCAVFIGNEGNGLPPEVASRCTVKATIRMSGHINSLNAAMATGIFMWEMSGSSIH